MTVMLPPEIYTRRAWLIGFWSVISVGCGMLAGILLMSLPWPQRLAAGGAIALTVAVPGILRPQIAALPMRAWNTVAVSFARGAVFWLTAVCFYVIFGIVGRLGSFLWPRHPAVNSLWTPWASSGYGDGDRRGGILIIPAGEGWAAGFARWVKQSGNVWAWVLLPFLLALSALETAREVEAPPRGIYTLY